jgi:hypothetical protein
VTFLHSNFILKNLFVSIHYFLLLVAFVKNIGPVELLFSILNSTLKKINMSINNNFKHVRLAERKINKI